MLHQPIPPDDRLRPLYLDELVSLTVQRQATLSASDYDRGAEEELQVGLKQIHEVLPYSASIRPLTSWPGTRGQEIGNLPATVATIASLKGIRVVGNPAR